MASGAAILLDEGRQPLSHLEVFLFFSIHLNTKHRPLKIKGNMNLFDLPIDIFRRILTRVGSFRTGFDVDGVTELRVVNSILSSLYNSVIQH